LENNLTTLLQRGNACARGFSPQNTSFAEDIPPFKGVRGMSRSAHSPRWRGFAVLVAQQKGTSKNSIFLILVIVGLTRNPLVRCLLAGDAETSSA
jgi:hypothetical protein